MYRFCAALMLMAAGFCLPASAACLSEGWTNTGECDPLSIYIYVDQKTVPAGEGELLVVAEPLTVNGLSPANGTWVEFFVRGSGGLARQAAPTRSGLAHISMPVGEVAGPVEIWAQTPQARSTSEWVDVLANEPAPFMIEFDGCDSTGLCHAEVSDLVDVYGNRLANGLLARLDVRVEGELVSQQSFKLLLGTIQARWDHPGTESVVYLSVGQQTAKLAVGPR